MAQVPWPSFFNSQIELDFFGGVKERSLLLKEEEISCSNSIQGMDGVGKGFLSSLWLFIELGVVLQHRIGSDYIYLNMKDEL